MTPTRRVRHTATLAYYDGPLVFEARDSIGGHYLASAAAREPGEPDEFLLRGVSPSALAAFRFGVADLRSVLLDSPDAQWFLARFAESDEEDTLLLEPQAGPLEDSSPLLPDSGFFLRDGPPENAVVEEARRRNALVVELAASPPEAANGHRMRAATLGGLLIGFQTLVTGAHRAATKGSSDGRLPPGSEEMDVVVPAAPGSFRVVLASAHPPDVFGGNWLTPAFHRLDEVFRRIEDPSETVAFLRESPGRFAGAAVKFLKSVADSTDFRYSWADFDSKEATRHSVPRRAAARIVEAAADSPVLDAEETEEVEVTGEFQKFHRGSGAWALLTEDGAVVAGTLRPEGPGLDGLVVGGRYRFVCEERVEAVSVSGRRPPRRYLVRHEPAADES